MTPFLITLLTGEHTARFVIYSVVCSLIAFAVQRIVTQAAQVQFPRVGKNPKGLGSLAAAREDFLHNGRFLAEDGYAKVSFTSVCGESCG